MCNVTNFKCTFAFALFDGNEHFKRNVLFRYSLDDEQWTMLNVDNIRGIGMTFQRARYDAIVYSKNEQYILSMGGFSSIYTSTTGDNVLSDTIAVYDVNANAFRVSSQRLPIMREPAIDFNCCIIRNWPLESFVMFGYVRRLYASEPFENVMDIPLHLLFLMTRWVAFDFVHVIYDQRHFQMRVDRIVKIEDLTRS